MRNLGRAQLVSSHLGFPMWSDVSSLTWLALHLAIVRAGLGLSTRAATYRLASVLDSGQQAAGTEAGIPGSQCLMAARCKLHDLSCANSGHHSVPLGKAVTGLP